MRRDGTASIWLYGPAIVLLGLVVIYPILRTLLLSFEHDSLADGFASEFAGLANYTRLAGDTRFQDSVLVTAAFSIISVALEFGLGLLLALAAERVRFGRSAIRTILLTPWILPTAIIAVLWGWIFNDQYGILNDLLESVGLINEPIAWLATPAMARLSIIMADVWKTTPFVFIVLLASLQNIPAELYEAMDIDGGGPWAKFRYVTWPEIAPFVFIVLVFRLIQAFAIFDLVWVMTSGGPAGSTETVSVYSYQTYMRYLDFGYGSTQAVALVMILSLIAFLLYQLLLKRRNA